MAQGLVHATRLLPEEVALWGLDRGLVPDPWCDERLQVGIRSSMFILRQLRAQYVTVTEQRDALLEEVQALRAADDFLAEAARAASPVPAQQPAQQPAFVPFAGTGRQLGKEDDLSRLD